MLAWLTLQCIASVTQLLWVQGLEAVAAVPPPGPYVKMEQPAPQNPTTLNAAQPQQPSVPAMSDEEAKALVKV